MQKHGRNYAREREKAIAEGMRDVAAELRLIDPCDLIAFIRTEQFGNIGALVNSSTEMFFKPGTVGFGLSGEVDLVWGSTPTIALDMEFRHLGVSAYFRVVLQALEAGIDISYIGFENGSPDPDVNTQRLRDAIEDARLVPLARPVWPRGLAEVAS